MSQLMPLDRADEFFISNYCNIVDEIFEYVQTKVIHSFDDNCDVTMYSNFKLLM